MVLSHSASGIIAHRIVASRPAEIQGNCLRRFVRATRFNLPTTAIAWAVCLVVLVFCLARCSSCFHWFIIPVLLCGVVISHDMVDWLRGRFDVFDPVGILGIAGFYFFFLRHYYMWYGMFG